MIMDPILLPANQPPDRFYLGGLQIAKFRELQSEEPRTSEDWIASTTCCWGHATLGQTRLPSGNLLLNEIERDPLAWLGPEHVQKFGADTKLLVKLIDAGQRIPVHAHPSAAWAQASLGARHGKAEAWYILSPGEVYLGLAQDVGLEKLASLVRAQDVEAMLLLMHRLVVQAHQTVFVPPGVLHAIGKGVLMVEVQEPEDLTILLEWKGFKIDGRTEGHLGLGFERALQAVEIRARSEEEISSLVTKGKATGSALAAASNEYFLLESVEVDGTSEQRAGYAVVIVVDGHVEMISEQGKALQLGAGSTVVVPYASGSLVLNGHGHVLIMRPPVPEQN